jgi:hypothetical protein
MGLKDNSKWDSETAMATVGSNESYFHESRNGMMNIMEVAVIKQEDSYDGDDEAAGGDDITVEEPGYVPLVEE